MSEFTDNSTRSLARHLKRALSASWLWLVLTVAISAVCAQTPPTEAPADRNPGTSGLPPLESHEHPLRGGENHSYRVSLTEGQFLHVIIEQKDIDVLVSAFGPEGKQLSETDSPNDRWGSEAVLLIADSSGDYRIQIRSPNNNAAPGAYAVRILALRNATAVDRDHAAAAREFNEARQLRAQPGTTAQLAAIEKYKSAIALFETVGDTYRQALSLIRVGGAYVQLSEFRRALPYFDETIRLARQLRDIRLEAGAETFLGGIRDVLGDIDKAISHNTRALQLARQTGAKITEASALNNIGKLYADAADWQKALEYYRQAIPVYREINSPREAITLNNIGIAYLYSGEPDKALEYLQQSLPLIRASKDRNAEAYTISNIGSAYYRLRKYERALQFLEQARGLQLQIGNRTQEAETLDLMGLVYSALQQPEKALHYHQRALEIQRATGNLRREALALASLGKVYLMLNESDKALHHLNQASSLFRAIGDLHGLAIALERTARAQKLGGGVSEARKSIEEALQLIETVRSRSGSPQLRASYLASREQAYGFYIDLLMQQHAKNPFGGYDAEALRAVERGRARSLLEMLAETTVDIRHGIDVNVLERERALAKVLNAKAQRQIQLLAQKGNSEEADILRREISALEDDYRQVRAKIRETSPSYAAVTQPQPLDLKEIQQQLDPDTLLLEYSLGDERSYLWAVTARSLQTFELPKRDQIQESAAQFYRQLTTRSHSVPGETAAQKRQRISDADAQLIGIRELSRMVLPAHLELKVKRIVVVADGALQYVPFGVLSLSHVAAKGFGSLPRPMIADYEVITLPSVSSLAVQRKNLANRKPAANAVAVIADPVFTNGDERLLDNRIESAELPQPEANSDETRIIEHIAEASNGKLSIRRLRFTREEAEQILAVAPDTRNLKALDFKANRAIATNGDLSRYRYVHFATHGYIDSERPDLSALVLSLVDQQGKPQDGFLRAHEIYNLNLPAELVVLSACQTGLGREIKGEGLVGLTQAFMYAGTRRVVVSLWNVNDKATAKLMQRFYRGLLKQGLTPAAALRQAQAEMARDPHWRSPYYWAAFVLQGDWR